MTRLVHFAGICSCLCLLLAACSSREEVPAIPDMPLIDAIAFIKDAGAISKDTLKIQAAEKSIGLALGDEWSDETGSGWQSIGILTHDRGTLLFQRQNGLPQNLRLALLDGDFVTLWKVVLQLGANFTLREGNLTADPGLDERLVQLVTENENALVTVPSRLYYAIGEDTCRLVWAEDKQGKWAADQVGPCHPNLVIADGKLNSRSVVDQLAALMALSQPAAKQERADTKIRSILMVLAQGTTNNRLAEAAAVVLTLPLP